VQRNPYDPTLKALIEPEPESWPGLLGQPTGPTKVIDADIATVSGAADKVLHVATDPPYLLHLEFAAGHDGAKLPGKMHVRNALLEDRHDLPVHSGAVLLRPGADSPRLTGVYERGFPGRSPYLIFRYQVVRVWQLPPEPLLRGGLSLLPLAPISAVTEAELPVIIRQMEKRLSGRRERTKAPMVWASAYILLGLRYSPKLAEELFRGVVSMKESSTYQAILEEGRLEGQSQGAVVEARKLLRKFAEDKLGPPDTRAASAIDQIDDLQRLEHLCERLKGVSSWTALLARSRPGPRGSRRHRSP
jgi:predicted transposase YdaD